MTKKTHSKEEWKKLALALFNEIKAIGIGITNWIDGEKDKSIEEKFENIKDYFVHTWFMGQVPNKMTSGIVLIANNPEDLEEQLFRNLADNKYVK